MCALYLGGAILWVLAT